MNKQLFGLVAKAPCDDERTAVYVASTSGVDRGGDTCAVTGWRIADYMKNGVVIWSHDYSRVFIGRCLSV
jgi:hypothetical protein